MISDWGRQRELELAVVGALQFAHVMSLNGTSNLEYVLEETRESVSPEVWYRASEVNKAIKNLLEMREAFNVAVAAERQSRAKR